jgi:hypothetical protein
MNNLEHILGMPTIFDVIIPLLDILSLSRLMMTSSFFKSLVWSIIEKKIQVEVMDTKIWIKYRGWERVFENKVIFIEDRTVNVYQVTYDKRDNRLKERDATFDFIPNFLSLPLFVTSKLRTKTIPIRKMEDKTTCFFIPEVVRKTNLEKEHKFSWELGAIGYPSTNDLVVWKKDKNIIKLQVEDQLSIFLFGNQVEIILYQGEIYSFGRGRNVYCEDDVNHIFKRYKICNLFYWVNFDLFLNAKNIA